MLGKPSEYSSFKEKEPKSGWKCLWKFVSTFFLLFFTEIKWDSVWVTCDYGAREYINNFHHFNITILYSLNKSF